MSGIGTNIHRNNVHGSRVTVEKSLEYDHLENERIIDEQAAFKRLQENNDYNLKTQKLNMENEEKRCANQINQLSIQGRINIDKINAESYAEERRIKLKNQRNKDLELHKRELESLKNQHLRMMKEQENQQEIERMESDRKMKD